MAVEDILVKHGVKLGVAIIVLNILLLFIEFSDPDLSDASSMAKILDKAITSLIAFGIIFYARYARGRKART